MNYATLTDNPGFGFWQTKLGVSCCNDDICAESQFKSAAKGVTLHCGHQRLFQLHQGAGDTGKPAADRHTGSAFGSTADVTTDTKSLFPLCRQYRDPYFRVAVNLLPRFVERLIHLPVDSVQGFRAVQTHMGNMAFNVEVYVRHGFYSCYSDAFFIGVSGVVGAERYRAMVSFSPRSASFCFISNTEGAR